VLLVTIENLVAGLTGYAEIPADVGHRQARNQSTDLSRKPLQTIVVVLACDSAVLANGYARIPSVIGPRRCGPISGVRLAHFLLRL
jgi:hypothetical protein